MASVPVADNDIIHLNIGGSLMSTKRLTLTQVGLLTVHAPGITAVSSRPQCVKHVAYRLKGLLWLQGSMGTGSNASIMTAMAVYSSTLTHTALSRFCST